MKRDERREIESEGLRDERNHGNELHDDSATKQRANLTGQAKWSEVTILSESGRGREREIN